MLTKIDPRAFRHTVIADGLDGTQVARAARDYRLMLLSVLEVILTRYERDPDYHFINTKLNTADGTDFDPADPLRGQDVIYAWIQGRGLESLAGHDLWLRDCAAIAQPLRRELSGRIRKLLAEVVDQMEQMRAANGGHLFFMMRPDGRPIRVAADGKLVEHRIAGGAPASLSDLFYAKGLAASASLLGDQPKLDEACLLFEQIDRDIQAGRFVSDQQPLDPRNVALGFVPGRHSHTARLIGVGAATLLLNVTGRRHYAGIGMSYIEHILRYHVDTKGATERCRQYDMWEFVDDAGRPYADDAGVLVCDPGHASEFVGLALKFLRTCRRHGALSDVTEDRVAQITGVLGGVLRQNFGNGFSPQGHGIVKQFDLALRRVIYDDMPFWSLPETMRAAIEACRACGREQAAEFARIAAECSNAFMRYFVRKEANLMAVQCIDRTGAVSRSIPAVPDADPGYHIGLSIIDCLEGLDKNTRDGASR
jgi:hypothetical protein